MRGYKWSDSRPVIIIAAENTLAFTVRHSLRCAHIDGDMRNANRNTAAFSGFTPDIGTCGKGRKLPMALKRQPLLDRRRCGSKSAGGGTPATRATVWDTSHIITKGLGR
jgi:hypothetical protein